MQPLFSGDRMASHRYGHCIHVIISNQRKGASWQGRQSSRAGLVGLTLEYAAKGARVNAIAAGMIMTDMLHSVNQDEPDTLDPHFVRYN